MYRKPYWQPIETMVWNATLFERRFLIDLASWRDKNSRRDAAWFTFALFLIVSTSRPMDMSRADPYCDG